MTVKNVLFLLVCLVSYMITFSQTGTITNIQVSQRTDGSGLADVYFTLSGTENAYYIAIEASFNGGNSFTPIPAGSLTGDTGPISPGTGKHIIWDGLHSFPNTYSAQAKVKLTPTTTPPLGLPCPVTPTIVYGGQTYNTVQIGTQCWLKENLNIGTMINGSSNQTNNGTIEKYCYYNDEGNCAIYGGLYQWNEMMQYMITPGVRGICPMGWHVPTDGEWTISTTFLGGSSVAGGKLKSIGTIEAGTGLWYAPNTGATNESGFTAFPTGLRYNSGTFSSIGHLGFWWSSSEYNSSIAWSRFQSNNYTSISRNYDNKNYGFSVRCIKDGCSPPQDSPTQGANIPSQNQIIWNWSVVSGAAGYKWNMTNDYNTATDMGTATTKTETELICSNPYTRYAWAYNNCGYSTPVMLMQTTSTCGTSCTDIPTVEYGGQTYTTVQIGTQCWFTENLNIGTRINGNQNQSNDGIIEKYCYNNDEANCAIYGGLYQWDEMMQYVTNEGVKGICPTGWHIPTDGEWTTLSTLLAGSLIAGGKLKSIGTIEAGTGLWYSPNTGATNESGFTANPAGSRYYGPFSYIGSIGFWWSSSEYFNIIYGFQRSLSYNDSYVNRSASSKNNGFSVRCLRDY